MRTRPAVCLVVLLTGPAWGQGVRVEPPSVPAGARPVLVDRGAEAGPRFRVKGIAFAPTGDTLVTADDGGQLCAWRVDSRVLLWTARVWPRREGGTLLAPPVFSHQGDRLAVLVRGRSTRRDVTVSTVQVHVYTAAGGDLVWSSDQILPQPWSGRQLAFLPGDRTIRALFDNGCADFGEHARVIPLAGQGLSLADDGRIAYAVPDEDGKQAIWVSTDGRPERALRALAAEAWPRNSRFNGRQAAFAFSPDGRRLAGATEGWLVVWQVETGEAVSWRTDLAVEHLAFSADGDRLATWQASTATQPGLGQQPDDFDLDELDRQLERELAALNTASQAERKVAIWSIAQRRRLALLGQNAVADVAGLAFRNDGRLLAVADLKGVVLYDVTGAAPPAGLGAAAAGDPVGAVAVSGGFVAVQSGPDKLLIWDCAGGRLADAVPVDAAAGGPALSPDGRWLVAQDLGQLEVGERAWRRTVRALDCAGHASRLTFSPSGRRLWALSSAPEASLAVWDTTTWQLLWRRAALPEHVQAGRQPHFDARVPRSYELSPDERSVAYREGESVYCLAAETGALQARFTLPALVLDRGLLAWQPDGRTLVGLDPQGVARFWSAETGEAITGDERLRVLRAAAALGRATHLLTLRGTVYTAAGELIASFQGREVAALSGERVAVEDRLKPELAVYDVRGCPNQPPRLLARWLSWDAGAEWAVLTPSGYYDASPGANRFLAWQLGDGYYPLDQYERRFRRPDLVRRWLAGEAVMEEAAAPGLAPPVITFVSPTNGFETNQSGVGVELEAAGLHALQRVELTVNGGPVGPEVSRRLTVSEPREARLRFKLVVPLPAGQTRARLRAVAVDDQGLVSRPAELVVYARGARPVRGALFVLAVGIDRYRSAEVPPLRYAAADARSVAELLGRQATGSLYREVHVRTLLDEQATLSALTFALRDLKDTAQEEDAVVLFVAGHGFEDSQGRYGFATHDLDPRRPLATALSWEAFVAALLELRAQRLLVLADTCHAGGLVGQRADPAQLADRLNRDAHRLVFSASRSDELSLGLDRFGHGAFTQALLEAMVGAADLSPKDGRLSFRELRDFVTARTSRLTEQRQHPTLPFLDGFEPETVLLDALYARPAPG